MQCPGQRCKEMHDRPGKGLAGLSAETYSQGLALGIQFLLYCQKSQTKELWGQEGCMLGGHCRSGALGSCLHFDRAELH